MPSLKGCICVRVESDRVAVGGRLTGRSESHSTLSRPQSPTA